MGTDTKTNRQVALECASWGNIEDLTTEQVVERAQAYLDFLTGDDTTSHPAGRAWNAGVKWAEHYLIDNLDYLAELWQTQGKSAVVAVIRAQAAKARA